MQKQTAREWLLGHYASYESRQDAAEACRKALGMQYRRSAYNALRKLEAEGQVKLSTGAKPKTNARERKPKKLPAGVEGFRSMFSKREAAKRKTERHQARVEAVIEGALKERTWIPDVELREIAGIPKAAWTNIRRDYEHLLIEARDESGRRYTVWAHPDHVEELRDIANE